MKRIATTAAMAIAVATTGLIASGDQGPRMFSEVLSGLKEAPAIVATSGTGTFKATLNKDGSEIDYELTFNDLESNITQSHIHIGYPQNSGAIVLWLCDSASPPAAPGLASPFASTPLCIPAGSTDGRNGVVTGTLTEAEVVALVGNGNPTWDEVVSLIRDGRTYVNIHTATIPAGEIRSQIDSHDGHSGHGGRH
jgi:hypothetical protein